MSQPAKRIKLEPDAHGNGHRKEDKNSLISGQFMTSTLDNDPEVKRTSLDLYIPIVNIFLAQWCSMSITCSKCNTTKFTFY
jgi:hypothetical protein